MAKLAVWCATIQNTGPCKHVIAYAPRITFFIRPDNIETLHDASKTRLHNPARTLSPFVHHAPEIIPCWINCWQKDLHYFSLFCTRPTSTKEDSPVLAGQNKKKENVQSKITSLTYDKAIPPTSTPLFWKGTVLRESYKASMATLPCAIRP